MGSHTLVAAVFSVPVFALHGGVGASCSDTAVWGARVLSGGDDLWRRRHGQLHLHLD